MMATPVDLNTLSTPWKVLISGFLVILGAGYLSAALNAALAVGLSPAAIADHYGNKRVSQEERAAIAEQGFVEEEFSLDDEPAMDEMDHGQHDMNNMEDMAAMPGMDHSQHDMADMGAMQGDDTLPPQVMAQLSHVHLLGFSFILLGIGALTCLTRLSDKTKAILVGTLFAGLLGDIASLNLTRFVTTDFSYLTIFTGTLIGVCLALMSLRILWELWGPTPTQTWDQL